VTMTGNSLRLAGKIPVLVKLMALTIYAKAGLLRPRTNLTPLDIDRDRCVGRFRPNQNDCVFFCNTCNAPYRDDGSSRFRWQTVKVEVRTGAIVKNSGICLEWAEPDKKNSIFRVFMVPFDYTAHNLQETILPKTNGTDGKPRL